MPDRLPASQALRPAYLHRKPDYELMHVKV